jgi:hypothetical protein
MLPRAIFPAWLLCAAACGGDTLAGVSRPDVPEDVPEDEPEDPPGPIDPPEAPSFSFRTAASDATVDTASVRVVVTATVERHGPLTFGYDVPLDVAAVGLTAYGVTPEVVSFDAGMESADVQLRPGTTPGTLTLGLGTPVAKDGGPAATASGNHVLTVRERAAPGCAVSLAIPYTGSFKRFSLGPGQCAAIALPALTDVARWAEVVAFQTTSTPSVLLSEVAISSLPGDFDVPPLCKQGGSPWASIDIHAFTDDPSYCLLTAAPAPGKIYYANVRILGFAEAVRLGYGGVPEGYDEREESSCPEPACEQGIQYIGNLQ